VGRAAPSSFASSTHSAGDDNEDAAEDEEGAAAGRETAQGARGAAPVIPPSLLELIPTQYRGAALLGDSAEEIARWRAARRRNFPTDERVAAKRAGQAAAADRGEWQGPPNAGRFHRKGGADGVAAASAAAAAVAAASVSTSGGPHAAGGAPGVGAGKRAGKGAGGDRDEDKDKDGDGDGDGNGDGDADGEGFPESMGATQSEAAAAAAAAAAREAAAAAAASSGRGRGQCIRFLRLGNCLRGDSCPYLHGSAAPAPGAVQAPPGGPCKWYLLGNCRAGARCPMQHLAGSGAGAGAPSSSLLRRLLAKDIEGETSALLQCIRFVVRDASFFDEK